MKTRFRIPATGGVRIEFPKWNMKAPRTVRGSYVLVPEQDGDEVSVELPDKLISEAQISTIDPSKLCTEVLVSTC